MIDAWKAELVQADENRVYRCLGGALTVCIFYAQYELAAVPAREQVAEQRGANAADVQDTGWARRKAGADGGGCVHGRREYSSRPVTISPGPEPGRGVLARPEQVQADPRLHEEDTAHARIEFMRPGHLPRRDFRDVRDIEADMTRPERQRRQNAGQQLAVTPRFARHRERDNAGIDIESRIATRADEAAGQADAGHHGTVMVAVLELAGQRLDDPRATSESTWIDLPLTIRLKRSADAMPGSASRSSAIRHERRMNNVQASRVPTLKI